MRAESGLGRGGRRGRWAWIVVNGGYAALLVVLALLPTPQVPGLTGSDLAAHAAAYGVQALLLFGMVASRSGPRAAAVAAACGAIGFGALTELLQRLQPARSADPMDIAANSIGAVLAVLGILGARRLLGTGEGAS